MPLRPELIAAAVAAALVAGASGAVIASRDSSPTAARLPASPAPTPAPTTQASSAAPTPTPQTRPSRTTSPTPRPPYPLPAAAVAPRPCPPPPRTGPPPKPRPSSPPAVAEADVPPPVALPARRVSLHAAGGKGMWLTTWARTELDAAAVVRRAKAAGLRQVWVRTGGTIQGYYGDRHLATLLPAAHAAGIAVIAWDFPTLSDPAADAARAARALRYTVRGQRIDGFAPDIETTNEGTHATARRVASYLSRVRAAAGDRPVVTTVPRPTAKRLASFPYTATGKGSDALTAMVYWSCLEPGDTTRRAIADLRRFHPHVAVVGQAYDMGPEGGRPGLPAAAETWRFLDVAKRHGAFGASLYQYDTAGPNQWRPLTHYPWR